MKHVLNSMLRKVTPFGLAVVAAASISIAQPVRAQQSEAAQVARLMREMGETEYRAILEILSGEATLPDDTRVLRNRFEEHNLNVAREFLADHLSNSTGSEVIAEPFSMGWNRDANGQNIFVDVPGTDRANEIVVISAHYDSAGKRVPGANDNATGVSAVLQMAAAMSRAKIVNRRTIRFALFDGEERGIIGSDMHFDGVLRRNENVVLHINMDMLGNSPKGVRSTLYDANGRGDVFGNFYREVNKLTGLGFRIEAWGPFESDQISSGERGYPAVSVSENAVTKKGGELPYHEVNHSKDDTIKNMNVSHAVALSQLIASTVMLAAQRVDTSWDDAKLRLLRKEARDDLYKKTVKREVMRPKRPNVRGGGCGGGGIFG